MLLSEKNLFKHFSEVRNSPLPFSLSALQKDRNGSGRLGVPYTPLSGKVLYDPDQIQRWIDQLPVVVPVRHKPQQDAKPAGRRGKPKKTESVAAKKLGLSVKEYRNQQVGGVL